MRRALILACAVMFGCAVSVVAQDPRTTAPGRSRAAMSPEQLPTLGAPSALRSARATADVRPGSALEVPPEASVVTVEGACDRSQASKTKECKTVITRAQIEDMINLLTPGASQAVRRQFVINYARVLAASEVAQDKHLEKDPEVARQLEAQLKITRMEVLAHSLYQQLAKDAENAPESEIQKYYDNHLSSFDEGEVLRLSVPRTAPTTDGRLLDESGVKAKAEELRARAAAGDDFAQLQHDAYVDLGISAIGPPTKLNRVRRSNLPPEEAKVFDLNPGEVSPVLESLGALVVLKLVSKQSVPEATLEPEIKSLLRKARMQEELDSATKTVKAQFNLTYLDMTSAPELFVPPAEAQQSASSGEVSGQRSQMMNRRGPASDPRRALRRPHF